MARDKKRQALDEEIIELTDIVQDGQETDQSSTRTKDQYADFDRELDELFLGSAEFSKPEGKTRLETGDDDLDLDSLFQELDSGQPAMQQSQGPKQQALDPEQHPVEHPDSWAFSSGADQQAFGPEQQETQTAKQSAGQGLAEVSGQIRELLTRIQDLEARLLDLPGYTEIEQRMQNQLQEALLEKLHQSFEQKLQEKLAPLEAQLQDLQHVCSSQEQEQTISLQNQLQDLRSQALNKNDLEEMTARLKQELSQEIVQQIPAEAARVVRKEIQALAREMQEDDT